MDILTVIENRPKAAPVFKTVTQRAVHFKGPGFTRVRVWPRAKARRAIRLAKAWGLEAYDAGSFKVTVSA